MVKKSLITLSGVIFCTFIFSSCAFSPTSMSQSKLSSPVPLPSSADSDFKPSVLSQINELRVQKSLSPFLENNEVCSAARTLTETAEKTYNSTTKSKDNVSMTQFFQSDSSQLSIEYTMADSLIQIMTKGKGVSGLGEEKSGFVTNFYSDKDLLTTFIKDESIFLPDYKFGCIAVSKGKYGYKPFGYFVIST